KQRPSAAWPKPDRRRCEGPLTGLSCPWPAIDDGEGPRRAALVRGLLTPAAVCDGAGHARGSRRARFREAVGVQRRRGHLVLGRGRRSRAVGDLLGAAVRWGVAGLGAVVG